MKGRQLLRLTPGLVTSISIVATAFLLPLDLNKLLLLSFTPVPILINYIAVNIRRVFAGVADVDYLFLITHMAAVATGRPPRHKLFELYSVTGQAYGVYSRTLGEISSLAKKWGYSYIQAIRHYIRRVRDQIFRDFLARFAEALNMGEDESLVLETERSIAIANYEARYHRSLEIMRILLGIYVATISSIIFININMIIISMVMWGSPHIAFASLIASISATSFLVYAIYKLSPKEKFLHDMRIQPGRRKTIAYTVLLSIVASTVAWTILYTVFGSIFSTPNYALIMLGAFLVPPGLLAHRFENGIKRIESFFQAFVRSYGLTYAVVRNHAVALRSILRVDLGPLTPAVKRLYTRLSNGIDKGIAWMYFAGENGSENIRRCVDVLYDTIDSGGDISKTGILLSETLLKLANLRGMRSQIARAFQGVVYTLHVIMVILLEFIITLTTIMHTAFQAVAGTGVLPFPLEAVDIGVLTIMKIVLLLAMSIINAIAIKVAEGGYIQTFWLHAAVFTLISSIVSLTASGLVKSLYEVLEIEELFQLAP
ncbi:MAG: type II secretion system F family protein [Ignisphaera sp.]|nr:type II secretion system F family protein [Ignisphaera sp.]MCX8167927.1 type II secretion system F family protein [Ignisphaera sp.]MDW8086166.1 type II secretion system F family protein [Ignisphaera sp.]